MTIKEYYILVLDLLALLVWGLIIYLLCQGWQAGIIKQ
jgi:hypothetical protein